MEKPFERKMATALGIKGGEKIWCEVHRVSGTDWVVRLQITLDKKQVAKIKPILKEEQQL